jgi:hypothetical protein
MPTTTGADGYIKTWDDTLKQEVWRPSAGIRHKRAVISSVGAGGTQDVTVTWNEPFEDASYTVTATAEDATGSLQVTSILSRTTSDCTVRVKNLDGGAVHSGTLHAHAIHLPPEAEGAGLPALTDSGGVCLTDDFDLGGT